MQPIHDFNHIIKSYPPIELSYETVSHKKVAPPLSGISVAVPHGKKCVLWTTVRPGTCNGIAYLFEIGKNHQNATFFQKGHVVHLAKPLPKDHKMGTIVYGTLMNARDDSATAEQIFVVDDVYMFKGQIMDNIPFGTRMPLLSKFMREFGVASHNADDAVFADFNMALALMFTSSQETLLEQTFVDSAAYNVRQIQYREYSKVAPYVNVLLRKVTDAAASSIKDATTTDMSESTRHVLAKMMAPAVLPKFSFYNPQFKQVTVFLATADVQFDVYSLFAIRGGDKQKAMVDASCRVFVGYAAIQSYRVSKMMNEVFRKIKENVNLDAIEESDDEEEFENVDEHKYVDTTKCAAIECVFNFKLKKWMPVRLADANQKIVHICALTLTQTGGPTDGERPKPYSHGHNRPQIKQRNNRGPPTR